MGCEQRCSVAMVDSLPAAGAAPCPTTVSVRTASALPAGLLSLGIKINFQKTRAVRARWARTLVSLASSLH